MASHEEETPADYEEAIEYDGAEGGDGADGAEASEVAAETDNTQDAEAELERMRKQVQEMEDEARKLQEMQESIQGDSSNKEEVDFGTTAEELQQHFKSCGTINRITILTDKWTGHPKGFAYIEFVDVSSVANALELNDSVFRGRPLKVTSKRTNLPPFAVRGGRGGGRGGYGGYPAYGGRGGGYRPPRGRGGPGRWRPPRGRYFAAPY